MTPAQPETAPTPAPEAPRPTPEPEPPPAVERGRPQWRLPLIVGGLVLVLLLGVIVAVFRAGGGLGGFGSDPAAGGGASPRPGSSAGRSGGGGQPGSSKGTTGKGQTGRPIPSPTLPPGDPRISGDGFLLAGAADALPVPAGGLAGFAGQPALAKRGKVAAVVSPTALWVGGGGADRVFVELVGIQGGPPLQVGPGDRVDFSLGRWVGNRAQDLAMVSGADRAQLGAQGAHVEVEKDDISRS